MKDNTIGAIRAGGIGLGLAVGLLVTPASADDHLLLCEAVATPTTDEFIELMNPTTMAVDLGKYYLSDDADYALLPGQFGAGPAPSIGSSDFIAQFPDGTSIAPGGVVVVAFDGAAFMASFGFLPDYEIFDTSAAPNMIDPGPGLIGATAGLTNSGENAVLFTWDNTSDLVQDVDMLNIGTPSAANAIANKTGVSVDGPDADEIPTTYFVDDYTMPNQAGDPGFGASTKRLFFEGFAEDQSGGGNGLTGHDETTEDITVTWDAPPFSAPNPGVCGPLDDPPSVVFSVTKDGPEAVFVGDDFDYTISIDNTGGVDVENVVITDTLPGGVTFVSESSDLGVLGDISGLPDIVWMPGTIPAGESRSITVTVTADAVGVVINTVTISTTTKGDDPADNMDDAETTIGEAPVEITINEFLYDPPSPQPPDEGNGDANGDGVRDGSEDEFVELVNTTGKDLDISGWEIRDAVATRHVFPKGTILVDGCGIVVFGGGKPTGDFGNMLVQTASTGFLGLNNGGDSVIVTDAGGFVSAQEDYDGSVQDESMTRDPDLTGGFVGHSAAAGAAGALFSPGTKVDGSNFDGCPGDACPWDTNGDGEVGPADLAKLLDNWGPNPGHQSDFNGDGDVGPADLAKLLDNWGPCP